jgi:hypothetical protein
VKQVHSHRTETLTRDSTQQAAPQSNTGSGHDINTRAPRHQPPAERSATFTTSVSATTTKTTTLTTRTAAQNYASTSSAGAPSTEWRRPNGRQTSVSRKRRGDNGRTRAADRREGAARGGRDSGRSLQGGALVRRLRTRAPAGRKILSLAGAPLIVGRLARDDVDVDDDEPR